MRTVRLVFSADGTSVYIKYKNNKKSRVFLSKQEAIDDGVMECYYRGRITKEECRSMLATIKARKKLPKHIKSDELLTLAAILLPQSFESAVAPIENPYVEQCMCSTTIPHAYLHNGNGKRISMPFQTKAVGLEAVRRLLQREKITEGDSAALNTLIDRLKLPESHGLN